MVTLNIFFITITIKRRKITREEADHQEMIQELYERHTDRRLSRYL